MSGNSPSCVLPAAWFLLFIISFSCFCHFNARCTCTRRACTSRGRGGCGFYSALVFTLTMHSILHRSKNRFLMLNPVVCLFLRYSGSKCLKSPSGIIPEGSKKYWAASVRYIFGAKFTWPSCACTSKQVQLFAMSNASIYLYLHLFSSLSIHLCTFKY